MKKIITILLVLSATTFFGQSPDKISYQAVVRNSSNGLVSSLPIGMKISILQGSSSGTAVYIETQNPTTNVNGLVSIEIGAGSVVLGSINSVDWGLGPYFIQTEIDLAGGTNYNISGTSQLLSVPYALHAKTAERILTAISETDPVFQEHFQISEPTDGQILRYNGTLRKWENITPELAPKGQYYFADRDADSFGDPFSTVWIPDGVEAPLHFVLDRTDCNDLNLDINSQSIEVCDGIDNNCDGIVDEDCKDEDQDGFFDIASGGNDCDDQDPTIFPEAQELCDGKDNDCDGEVDENSTHMWFQDNDGDGFGLTEMYVYSCTQPEGYIETSGDCNDDNPSIHPDAIEMCDNGIDDDCNGVVDETVYTYYRDADGDQYGNNADFVISCIPPEGYVFEGNDCDDTDATVFPTALEVADDKDNDCDGEIDEKYMFYQDLDGDDWGNIDVFTMAYYPVPDGYAQYPGDCDDENPTTHPNAAEICDNDTDDDCDGLIDEISQTLYQDLDGDGFGNPAFPSNSCTPPDGYVDNDGDCDDNDAGINPGAEEILGNDIDENCNSSIEE